MANCRTTWIFVPPRNLGAEVGQVTQSKSLLKQPTKWYEWLIRIARKRQPAIAIGDHGFKPSLLDGRTSSEIAFGISLV